MKTFRQFLAEIQKLRLIHGTTRKALDSIKQDKELTPAVGHFVNHAYRGDYNAAGIDLPKVTYLSGVNDPSRAITAMRFHVAKHLNKSMNNVTDDDLKAHGALVVARPNKYTSWKMRDDQTSHNLAGQTTYRGTDDTVAEPGDWWSTENVPITGRLTGNRLVKFINKRRK